MKAFAHRFTNVDSGRPWERIRFAKEVPHDKTQAGSKSFAYAPFGPKTTTTRRWCIGWWYPREKSSLREKNMARPTTRINLTSTQNE